jgi:hypothetical protein
MKQRPHPTIINNTTMSKVTAQMKHLEDVVKKQAKKIEELELRLKTAEKLCINLRTEVKKRTDQTTCS